VADSDETEKERLRIMDLTGRTLILTAGLVCASATAQAEPELLVIYEFSQPTDQQQWRTINDTVMGGVSSSSLQTLGDGIGVFRGYVSLENYGGFASVRSQPKFRDLSEWTGLALRVRGDGKGYKLALKMDANLDGIMYQASFPTTAGEWTEVRLPFATCCAPTFRGRDVPGAPALDPARIMQISLMISDKQEGPFQLEIDWIAAFR